MTCAGVVCHNLINQCGILQQITNRGHTFVNGLNWLEAVSCVCFHSQNFENAFCRSLIVRYQDLFKISVKEAGGFETSAINCHC